MDTARAVEASELLLSDSELQALIHIKFSKYAACVFKILRAKELVGYKPATAAYNTAIAELSTVISNRSYADQILEFHFEAERECRILDGAEDDAQFLHTTEALRGMSTAPLKKR